VKLTKEMPVGCRELGEVYGRGGGGGYTSADRKLSVARNSLREAAAAKGGNWVVMDAINTDQMSTSIAGRVFKCPLGGGEPPGGANAVAAPPEPEPEVAPEPDAAPAAEPAPTEAAPDAGGEEPTKSVEERLTELKNLHDKELITDEEYEARKATILEEL
jgi:hypothetical protein